MGDVSLGKSAYLGEAVTPEGRAQKRDLPFSRLFQKGSDFSVTPTSSRRGVGLNRLSAITLVLEAASSAHDLAYPSENFELNLAPTSIFSLSAAPPRLEIFAMRCRRDGGAAACWCHTCKPTRFHSATGTKSGSIVHEWLPQACCTLAPTRFLRAHVDMQRGRHTA